MKYFELFLIEDINTSFEINFQFTFLIRKLFNTQLTYFPTDFISSPIKWNDILSVKYINN